MEAVPQHEIQDAGIERLEPLRATCRHGTELDDRFVELHDLVVITGESSAAHGHACDVVLAAVHQKKLMELRASIYRGPDLGRIAAVGDAQLGSVPRGH